VPDDEGEYIVIRQEHEKISSRTI